ncbi:uncharacterized protein [Miscanthus floridulus]|uniref:uncharacterized protein n=1 Tax=Miscanthus floridulus TaxID=154761 RepID=UPI0034581BDB
MRNDLCTPIVSLPSIADAWVSHVNFVFNLPPSPRREGRIFSGPRRTTLRRAMDTDATGMDEAEAAFFVRRGRRCCCFPWPASSHQQVDGAAVAAEETWWQRAVDAVLKVREWSELVGGPRWKTFIRRFGRSGTPTRPHRHFSGCKLNYDALSYVLNFNEGHGASPEGDYIGYRDFSTCFVGPSASAKSSMDLTGSTLGMDRRPLPSPREMKRKSLLPPGGGRLATIYRGAPPPE